MDGIVLIVDDDADARAIHRRILNVLDVRIEVAAGGEEALALIERDRPDVVLLDLMMPGMDGFEVLRHLGRNPDTAHLPVIVVSAYSVDPEELPEFPGLVGILQKGRFRVPELRQVVMELLVGDFDNAVSMVAETFRRYR